MIEIRNLVKAYNPKDKSHSRVLRKLTFNLPDRGMVFVCGKSGSGKSTLLNVLGGLDHLTSGEITVDGNKFSEFKESDYDKYRNSYVGFVFQDFCLMDNLTVKENIELALQLQGEKNDELVTQILREVDLEGYEDRYPVQLSGGQKQRVAISRALVKKPRLILADEPTGNLDSRTSKQILNLLKELSKNTLIIIVSHNVDDANEYADRIIELSDGRVIKDVERKDNKEFKIIDGKVINIPSNIKLTKEELNDINSAIKTGEYEITQEVDNFKDTEQPDGGEDKEILSTKSLSFKNNLKLSKNFTKGHESYTIFTAIMVAILVVLLTVSQVFAMFDGKELIHSGVKLAQEDNFILNKGYYTQGLYPILTKDKLIDVTESDIKYFYDEGYEGNIYKLYSKSLPLKKNRYDTNIDMHKTVSYTSISSFYIEYGVGVLETDEHFLINLYGKNGKLNILAGSLEESFKPQGLVISDYMADAMIYHNASTYKDLTKEEAYQKIIDTESFNNRMTIKAIFKTDYLSRYSNTIAKFKFITKIDKQNEKLLKLQELRSSDEFVRFYNELTNYLSIGYYLGEDYVNVAMNNQFDSHSASVLNDVIYGDEEGNLLYNTSQFKAISETRKDILNVDVNDGEVYVSSDVYNKLFETNLTYSKQEGFEQKKITIKMYDVFDTDYLNPILEKELTIVGLNKSTKALLVSEDDFITLSKYSIVPYALYFDNAESIASIYSPSEDMVFYSTNQYYKAIYTVMDIVTVFNEFFLIIVIGLTIICFILMISFGRRSVKRKMFDIGVLRSLGGKTKHIYVIFMYQVLFLSLLVGVISTIGMILLDELINTILVENLAYFLYTDIIRDLTIIEFNPLISLGNSLAILVISFLSSFVLISTIRKVKPMNIIRNKE